MLLDILNEHYPMRFEHAEFMRDAGSTSYSVFAGGRKYFLRIVKPALFEIALQGADIQVFLQERGFPVPPVVITKEGVACVPVNQEDGKRLYVLYDYIEGSEANPEQDAEALGKLVGQLHHIMKKYPGALISRDRYYYVDKYIDILRQKQYRKAGQFAAYGQTLWEKVKDLPRRYCHGDMYSGNFHKTPDGKLYVLDFDTSCEGFPMYDLALICNKTHYFQFKKSGYEKSKQVLACFLQEYLKYNALSQAEIDTFYDFVALYHFALQAAVIELFGLDCVDEKFLDRQWNWLYRWRKQCGMKH